MTETNNSEAKKSAEVNFNHLAGKYLTFRLETEEYGFEILKVREIIGLMEITKVPKTPDYIRGVINLRGKVISVMDLRIKFGMDIIRDTDETCIIVVEESGECGSTQMGMLVDAVSEVLDIQENQLEGAPEFGTGVNTKFILGIGKVNKEVKILLDIDTVLASSDLSSIDDIDSADNIENTNAGLKDEESPVEEEESVPA